LEVDENGRLVADHPGIVSHRKKRYVACPAVELGPVVHDDVQDPGHLILKVRGLAALGLDQGLYRGGPLPARLECRPADHGPSYFDQLHFPLGKRPHLVWFSEALQFRFFLVA
jgi:hypothetical protein